MATEAWSALILAGGRSSRMGRDKARLPWEGGELLASLRDRLYAAGAVSVYISGALEDYAGIPDSQPGLGPVGGLASALPQIDNGPLLVVPVDMPLIDATCIAALRAGAGRSAAARFQGETLPLWLRLDAALRLAVVAVAAADAPQRSLNALFDRLDGVEVPCPASLRRRLRGCNTPEEWQAVCDIQAGGGR